MSKSDHVEHEAVEEVVEQVAEASQESGKKRQNRVKYFDYVHDDGKVELKFKFLNGHEAAVFAHGDLLAQLVALGMKQYFQGVINGAESVEKAIEAVEHAIGLMDQGKFVEHARAGRKGAPKLNDLEVAVAEVRGVAVEVAKAWLDKREAASRGFKLAVRNDPSVALVLARLAAERAAQAEESGKDEQIDMFADLA